MSEYTQGVLGTGATILKDGEPMTIDQIIADLTRLTTESNDQFFILAAISNLCIADPELNANEVFELIRDGVGMNNQEINNKAKELLKEQG